MGITKRGNNPKLGLLSTHMPLWLTKIWNWLKIAGTWLRGNWFLALLLVGIVYTLVLAKNKAVLYDQLMRELRNQQAQNRKDLEELRKIQQDQIQKQQEIDRKYQEVVAKIEQDYRNQLRILTADKEKELRAIIARNNDDPNFMATEINNLFGIPLYIVPPPSSNSN